MTRVFTGTVTCDKCHESQRFELFDLNGIEEALRAKAERYDWEIGSDDLCGECVAERDREGLISAQSRLRHVSAPFHD